MFRLLFAMVFVLLFATAVNAASGYDLVTVPPVSGMVSIGETRTFCVLNTGNGQRQTYTAIITNYVVWNQPIRPPEYRIEIMGMGWWFIVNRETLDGNSC